MGICWSGDVEGGKQAVGGAQLRSTMAHNNFGANDAIDFFFRAPGLTALFSQIEVGLVFYDMGSVTVINEKKEEPLHTREVCTVQMFDMIKIGLMIYDEQVLWL
ncbi:hypothetical protein Patl1_22795 [Pistacia atlantica]|uniref:Uncharacterized protein n=1 Tax=Pistacia atlantica TaxID=434234 RepID=A0ACC1A092_9ROSI|nr:hypothetical protein Patl1_22795 [Pistacia atlantica]